MQEVINRPKKSSKKNTGYSGYKLGTAIGCSPSTPHSEVCSKVKIKQSSGKRGNCLLHGPNTQDTNNCKMIGAQDERTKKTMLPNTKLRINRRNVPSPPPSTTMLGRRHKIMTCYIRQVRTTLPHLSRRLRLQIKGRQKSK